jgi:hypothetical protein
VRSDVQKHLLEGFLDLPEVGGLAAEGGAMDLEKCRKPLGVVPSEVVVECLVGVEPQKLAYDLDSEDLRVGEFGGGSTLAQGFPVLEPIVHQAEDGHDEGVKIQKRRPP